MPVNAEAVNLYTLGIKEGFKRAANLIREDMIKSGYTIGENQRLDIVEIGEDFAKMLEMAAE